MKDERAQASAAITDLDHARAEKRGIDQAQTTLRGRLYGLRSLFGDAVAHQVETALEPLEEHAYDACIHYEREIKLVQDELGLKDRIITERGEALQRQTETIDKLSAELVARYRRARRPIPEWIQQIRSDVEAPF